MEYIYHLFMHAILTFKMLSTEQVAIRSFYKLSMNISPNPEIYEFKYLY